MSLVVHSPHSRTTYHFSGEGADLFVNSHTHEAGCTGLQGTGSRLRVLWLVGESQSRQEVRRRRGLADNMNIWIGDCQSLSQIKFLHHQQNLRKFAMGISYAWIATTISRVCPCLYKRAASSALTAINLAELSTLSVKLPPSPTKRF